MDWKDKPYEIQPISGGLTNSNYKVVVENQPYFVRIPGESTELLAVDRQNEYEIRKQLRKQGSTKCALLFGRR